MACVRHAAQLSERLGKGTPRGWLPPEATLMHDTIYLSKFSNWPVTLSVAPSMGACAGGMPWGGGPIGMAPGGMPGNRPACCRHAAASAQQQHAEGTIESSH